METRCNVKRALGLIWEIEHSDGPTWVGAVWVSLLQHRGVALVHVFEHSVQCGVEESRGAAALRPQRHQLRALSEAREHWKTHTHTHTHTLRAYNAPKPQSPWGHGGCFLYNTKNTNHQTSHYLLYLPRSCVSDTSNDATGVIRQVSLTFFLLCWIL